MTSLGLEAVSGDLSVRNNDALRTASLYDPPAGDITITDINLPALQQARALRVDDNAVLESLALPALERAASLGVRNNPHLPACAVDELFARLPDVIAHQEATTRPRPATEARA